MTTLETVDVITIPETQNALLINGQLSEEEKWTYEELREKRKMVSKTVVRTVEFKTDKNLIQIEIMERMSVLESIMAVVKQLLCLLYKKSKENREVSFTGPFLRKLSGPVSLNQNQQAIGVGRRGRGQRGRGQRGRGRGLRGNRGQGRGNARGRGAGIRGQ